MYACKVIVVYDWRFQYECEIHTENPVHQSDTICFQSMHGKKYLFLVQSVTHSHAKPTEIMVQNDDDWSESEQVEINLAIIDSSFDGSAKELVGRNVKTGKA